MHQDYLLATGLQFCPGDKVQVRPLFNLRKFVFYNIFRNCIQPVKYMVIASI